MKRLVCVLLAFLLLLLCGCQKETVTPNWAAAENKASAPSADADGWQEKYDLGVRYLNDGNYEEAVIAFTAAIEIDPKNPDGYLRLADAYMGQGDTEAALRTLRDGTDASGGEMLTERAYAVKEEILDNNPALAELPAAVVPGEEDASAAGPRLYRSVILADRDGAPVQFALVSGLDGYDGNWQVVRYRVGEDGSIQSDALFSPITDGGRTDVYVYYDATLGCICAANASRYARTQTGVSGYDVVIYTITDTVQEYRRAEWNNFENALEPESYDSGIDQMREAGLPYFPEYFEKNYDVVMNAENLASCRWLYKHDSFNDFDRPDRARDGWMVEWTQEELSEFEDRMHQKAHDLIRREERLREAEKYRLEQRPELRPADADVCFGEQTPESVYGGFALVRENSSREIATFCIAFTSRTAFEELYDRVCDEIQIEPVERCFVYRVENGSEEGLRFSFDPETEKLYALRAGAYTVFGDYLVQVDPEVSISRGCCRLLTVRGTELETLMEDVYVPECYVHDDVLYLSGMAAATDDRSPSRFRICRYTLQEKRVEYLTDLLAMDVLDVGADYIDYLALEENGDEEIWHQCSQRGY